MDSAAHSEAQAGKRTDGAAVLAAVPLRWAGAETSVVVAVSVG